MDIDIQNYKNGLCCPAPVVTYNFDVDSSDWAGAGITDQASFEGTLRVTVDQFILSGNNIKANILTVNGNALGLSGFNVTNVNYITVSGLQDLDLSNNQNIQFNPSLSLPTSLVTLSLSSNQMTTSGYTSSETWANGIHNAPSGGIIDLSANVDSASGTNLETILIAKGWTVQV